jgi:NAD(P) transhydrogenase
MQRYDFLVIGSGPAGQRAAIQAAKLGKSVAIVERKEVVGGVSVHTGTIPSKTLREAALYLSGWNQRGLYGHSYRLKEHVTIDDLMTRLHITLQHEISVIQEQLQRNGVNVIYGTGSFKDPNTVQVESCNGETHYYEADKILIATGSRPVKNEGIPFDNDSVIDSDALLQMKKTPKTMAIIGAGVIGVEYASIFGTLDTKVTLIDGRPDMLGFLDHELVEELLHHMRERGTMVKLGENVAAVEKADNGQVITSLESGKRIVTDVALFAAGRMGSTYGLNLDNAGISTDKRRRIKVNGHFQTVVEHIYAAGDVIGFPSLASTSMEQGRLVACHAFGICDSKPPEHFPFGIYAVPEISMIGMNEQELTEQKIPYETGIARLRETARGQIMGLENGILKLLINTDNRKILGVHILGEQATELIHIGQAVLTLGGTLDYFLENVFNYPTLAEAYKVAALDAWNRISTYS